MDPLTAFSVAAGVIAFVDFGGKLISTLSDIRHSDDGLPGQWSTLVAEAQELSGHVAAAKRTVSNLQARYPRQAEAFERLDEDCTLAGQELQALVDDLAACPGRDLKSRASQALALAQGLRKRGDLRALEGRFSSIRQQTQLSVLMCIWEDVAALGNQKPADAGNQRRSKSPVSNINYGQQLPAATGQKSMADVLWDSTSAVLEFTGPVASTQHGSPPSGFPTPETMYRVHARVLRGLIFKDMTARKNQIEAPFPRTFQWLLDSKPSASDGSSTTVDKCQTTGFARWLASEDETPFWVTGKPASGKSTLMKFICTEPRVKKTLRLWSEPLRLLTCDIYIWNPGPSMQKSQLGLLRTILYQILVQDPGLCQHATPKHYLFLQLPGTDMLDPPEWTVDQLRDAITRVVSAVQETHRIAMFIDGLDEYEGNLSELTEFLKKLCEGPTVKLCVSSRPWNVFKDAFDAYPSLRMELLTKPDIQEYVQRRMSSSRAFQELRRIEASSVGDLESQIVEKAEGIFLWVVLVVESLLLTAQDDNNLQTIWKVFEALPPGLEELYSSMRNRLQPARLQQASKMYQLIFQWTGIVAFQIPAVDFWVGINCCQDPAEHQPYPTEDTIAEIKPLLERQVGGCTGGILQIVPSDSGWTVGFLHLTVYDWLRDIWPTIISDGPSGFDPALVIASVLASRPPKSESGASRKSGIANVFRFGRACRDLPESRSSTVRIIDGLSHEDLVHALRPFMFVSSSTELAMRPSTAALRSLAAITYACVPYLQAKMESGVLEKSLGLSRMRLSRGLLLPGSKSMKGLLSLVLKATAEAVTHETETAQHLRIQTLKLVLEIPSVSRRAIEGEVVRHLDKRYKATREYWTTLWDVLSGAPVKELPGPVGPSTLME